MKSLLEFLNTNVKEHTIKATDDTIKQIIKDELDRLGHQGDLNHIDTSKVTDMKYAFSCGDAFLGKTYKDLNPDISKWNVSKVTQMYSMFYGCENFNCDISDWDVSNVEGMGAMFDNCKKFNQDLSNWDVCSVKWHANMFDYCPIKEEFKPKFKK